MAARTGRDAGELHREFVFQRLLARTFDTRGPWILAGGTGLLVRLPGARHSLDIDLQHGATPDVDTAIDELRAVCEPEFAGDPLRFSLSVKDGMRGMNGGVTLLATPSIGGIPMTEVPIDLAVGRQLVGAVDHVAPAPVVRMNGVADPPPFTLYPLVDQVADKVAALYQGYGRNRDIPSSRWRDLADLVLVTRRLPLEAEPLRRALALREQQRGFTLPAAVRAPSAQWREHYPILARTTVLPETLHDLDQALAALGRCIDPLLDGRVPHGRWDPMAQVWQQRSMDQHTSSGMEYGSDLSAATAGVLDGLSKLGSGTVAVQPDPVDAAVDAVVSSVEPTS
ncbi:nucleotidyl transferase AbiEii/AbiGii toxin family protein [Nocardia niigatensis]